MELIVNHVPGKFEIEDVRQEVENKYRNKVAAVFPYTEPLLALASQSIFALQYATHPLTLALKELTDTFKP
jgi:MinD-like ATPase involved in chromosome partitioning or flagellar assembly